MSEALKAKPTKYYVHMAVILALMIGVGFLPPFGTISAYGMRILGIFLGCIYAWTVGEMIWPSILALLLMSLSGNNSIATVMGSAYGHSTLLMVVFALLYCYAIANTGVLEILSKRLLSMKFAQKGPWFLALAFFATSSIVSAIIMNGLPTMLLLWSIFYDVSAQIGEKPYSKYTTLVMIGIVICGYAGAVVFPFQLFTLTAVGVLQAVMPGATIQPLSYIIVMVVLNIAVVCALTLVFKLVCGKVEFKPVAIDASNLKMTTRQKIALGSIPVFALLLILPTFLPADNILCIMLTRLGTLGVIMLMPVVLMMMTYKREQFLDINDGMMHGVMWKLVFLLATALALSSAICSAETGISVMLSNLVAPLLAGKSAFAVIAIIVGASTIITNCINNIVTLTLLTPIMYTYVTAAGGDPLVAVTLMAFTCLQGVVMPAGSACGAMMHGNTEWLKPGMIYKYATIGEIVLTLCAVVIGVPVAMAIV